MASRWWFRHSGLGSTVVLDGNTLHVVEGYSPEGPSYADSPVNLEAVSRVEIRMGVIARGSKYAPTRMSFGMRAPTSDFSVRMALRPQTRPLRVLALLLTLDWRSLVDGYAKVMFSSCAFDVSLHHDAVGPVRLLLDIDALLLVASRINTDAVFDMYDTWFNEEAILEHLFVTEWRARGIAAQRLNRGQSDHVDRTSREIDDRNQYRRERRLGRMILAGSVALLAAFVYVVYLVS